MEEETAWGRLGGGRENPFGEATHQKSRNGRSSAGVRKEGRNTGRQ